jgi:hypothetical protein
MLSLRRLEFLPPLPLPAPGALSRCPRIPPPPAPGAFPNARRCMPAEARPRPRQHNGPFPDARRSASPLPLAASLPPPAPRGGCVSPPMPTPGPFPDVCGRAAAPPGGFGMRPGGFGVCAVRQPRPPPGGFGVRPATTVSLRAALTCVDAAVRLRAALGCITRGPFPMPADTGSHRPRTRVPAATHPRCCPHPGPFPMPADVPDASRPGALS